MKQGRDELQDLRIGTRVTVFNSNYNKREPFTGTVVQCIKGYTTVDESGVMVINPDIEMKHLRFRRTGQHKLDPKEEFEVIQFEMANIPEDLFAI
jgi:hypothetical protein